MAEAVYMMCCLTSLFCATLLIRSFRRQRSRLLMWASLCFVGLAGNNAILVVDLMVVPEVDLSTVRVTIGTMAMLLLLIGLIWESR
jgi:Family of unknown function (DUF5985)